MKISAALMFCVAAVVTAGAVSAAPSAPLARTGQTVCFDSSGNSAACAGSGQDGETMAGVRWPSPRFFNDGSGVISDYLTGLGWSRDAHPAGTAKTWQGALEYIKSLNSRTYQGHSDWRLPNISELTSLMDAGQTSPAAWLNTAGSDSPGFTNVQDGLYFSSTSGPLFSGQRTAYSVHLSQGIVSKSYSTTGYVWPVRTLSGATVVAARLARTGQTACYDPATGSALSSCAGSGQDGEQLAGIAIPGSRFTPDTATGTVSDSLTGLEWSNDGSHQSFGSCSTVASANAISWQAALDLVACLNSTGYRGHGDWRMPNISELLSLFNPAADNVADWLRGTVGILPAADSASPGYWSSTTALAGTPVSARTVSYYLPVLGGLAQSDLVKSGAGYLLPVRTAAMVGARLSVVPQSFDFGTVYDSAPATRTFTVMNTTNSALTLRAATSAMTGDTALFSRADTCNNAVLPPGGSCVMTVTFPAVAGRYGAFSASWSVTSPDDAANPATITVSGTAQKDTAAPAVIDHTLAAGEVSVLFSEAIKPSTVTAATLSVSANGVGIAGTVSYDAVRHKALFTPAAPLSYNVTYTVKVTTGIADLAGNFLPAPLEWSFTPAGGTAGDIRGADGVTIDDALQALKVAVGVVQVTSLTAGERSAADMNGDGKVTVADALMILRKYLGL